MGIISRTIQEKGLHLDYNLSRTTFCLDPSPLIGVGGISFMGAHPMTTAMQCNAWGRNEKTESFTVSSFYELQDKIKAQSSGACGAPPSISRRWICFSSNYYSSRLRNL